MTLFMDIGGHLNQIRKANNRFIFESVSNSTADGAGKFVGNSPEPLSLCILPLLEASTAKNVAAM